MFLPPFAPQQRGLFISYARSMKLQAGLNGRRQLVLCNTCKQGTHFFFEGTLAEHVPQQQIDIENKYKESADFEKSYLNKY